jgi:hypothetical protein
VQSEPNEPQFAHRDMPTPLAASLRVRAGVLQTILSGLTVRSR